MRWFIPEICGFCDVFTRVISSALHGLVNLYFSRRSGEFGLPFLRQVREYATWLVGELHKQENLKELNFKVGIHAVPSLEPFHVHVISTDMRSSRIKHKKHWNSFNTPFFVELSEAEEILQRDGELWKCAIVHCGYNRAWKNTLSTFFHKFICFYSSGNLHSILSREAHLRDDLLCNVCGHNFGGHFTKLIRHVMVCSQHPATKRSAAVDDYSENQTKSRRLESWMLPFMLWIVVLSVTISLIAGEWWVTFAKHPIKGVM